MNSQIQKMVDAFGAQHRERLDQLGMLLTQYGWLWRQNSYGSTALTWPQHTPGLAQALLALDDGTVQHLTNDTFAARTWLMQHLPELVQSPLASDIPVAPTNFVVPRDIALECDVPGRKAAQLAAMITAMDPAGRAVVDWCGGKGHLGRWLSRHWQVPVSTLDKDARLCAEGQRLARRAGVLQEFVVHDVLQHDAGPQLNDKHAVALHACGDLHRTLVCAAVRAHSVAIDIMPCCYHVSAHESYHYVSAAAELPLTRLEAKLAVTDESTSSAREQRLRDRAMAWKFGFSVLARDALGVEMDGRVPPGKKHWLQLEFTRFCRALAEYHGFSFSSSTLWLEGEAEGWKRLQRARRLAIPRIAFRRALELYLVSDLAVYLSDHDYVVTLSTVCTTNVTPRNVLLSARRPSGG